MLEFKKVEKTFPGVRALKGIDFEIKRGEIVGLVGENGAGKSTLMKVIYGAYQHDGGEVLINGTPVVFRNPRDAMENGIGMVFQEQSLITNLTVMENIFLGFEAQFMKFGIINWRKMAQAACEQLKKVKLDVDPYTTTSELSFTQRQLVELAKVLTLEERVEGDLVILLDEPTSVLPRKEIELLFDLVRELRSRASFVFVSHRMDEVIELSDRIYVMKDGEVVDVVDSDGCDVDAIQHKMVGREIDKRYYREDKKHPYQQNKVLVETRNLGKEGEFSDVSLKLRAGEVLALVGTEGCGTEGVIRSIFGLDKPTAGELYLNGEPVRAFSAFNGVRSGVGYIPRERKIEGIVGGMSVVENMTLANMQDYSTWGVFKSGVERELAEQWVSKLSIKTATIDTHCGNLSGGNQQKVVLSKWRSAGAKIILLDHPTRGLDIGAKEDVYDMVREMCDDGCGVILIADTLEEALGLAHTIAVFKDGEIQKWFESGGDHQPDQYDLLHYMI
ncbi:ABC transporter ATP-binding protein [Marinobacterium nitratireducens]|uniref:ABC transporter ATP-binding protein n=1 Tax=Marinobacterium nitratireducens TaxID=518897 RepID=A0A917ZJ15_9GAMM|nr:sugar ABC transporter ATP-binding protein [Marinobacterium nitratireducens]GGO83883.1 ABC transporter ATP-binding protein [Marinobacterium nitratireducens]